MTSTSRDIGLLYVANVKPLVDEVCICLEQAEGRHVPTQHSIQENEKPNLTKVTRKAGKDLKGRDTLIVIADSKHWRSLWREKSNKMQNKLEELMEDEDDDGSSKAVSFILIVGCNLDQAEQIQEDELKAYFSESSSKVSHKLVSVDMTSSQSVQSITAVARDIVKHFSNQVSLHRELHHSVSLDTVDTCTCKPTQTPIQSIEKERSQPMNRENLNTETSGINFSVPQAESEVPKENNSYILNTVPGLCLYIGLLEFDPLDTEIKLDNRHASMAEMEKIQSSFEKLGCYVKALRNPTRDEAEQFLCKGKEYFEKLKPSFLVLIISTHGQEVTMKVKDESAAKAQPSDDTLKVKPRCERVHQLFFHDGETLLTRDIVKMFNPSRGGLPDKPRLFFIQACRSRFDTENHENFDPGVEVLHVMPEGNIQGRLHKREFQQGDTSDAKKSNKKLTEEDQNKRVMEVRKVQTLDYIKWISEKVEIDESSDGNLMEKLSQTLTDDGFLPEQKQEILDHSKGYERYILDYFYPEPVVSEPSPCSNDALIMFASAPGKEAYNRHQQGGWLIINLEAQLKETFAGDPEKVDLLAELTKVSYNMAYKYETETYKREDSGHKSVPCLYHKLSKDFIVWPEEMRKAKELCEKEKEWQEFLKWEPRH